MTDSLAERFPKLAARMRRNAGSFLARCDPYQREVKQIRSLVEHNDMASLEPYLLFEDKGEMDHRIFLQVTALAAFEDIGESSVPILERAFHGASESQWRCCEGIIRAIAWMRGEAAGEFLLKALAHPSYGVRYYAAYCIYKVGYAKALPELRAELSRTQGNPQLSSYAFALRWSIKGLESSL